MVTDREVSDLVHPANCPLAELVTRVLAMNVPKQMLARHILGILLLLLFLTTTKFNQKKLYPVLYAQICFTFFGTVCAIR